MSDKKWTIPENLKPYLKYIYTYGYGIEHLMNNTRVTSDPFMAIKATIVESKVELLKELIYQGVLK